MDSAIAMRGYRPESNARFNAVESADALPGGPTIDGADGSPPPPPQQQPEPHRRSLLRRGRSGPLWRSDSFKRQQDHKRRSSVGEGLFVSLRRMSSGDPTPEDPSSGAIAPSSVSDYQEVFQEFKREHPTASLGALQQMSMARMALLKAAREQEERELQMKQEEEQLQNQASAKKFVDKWVGKMRPSQNSPQDHIQQLDWSERTSSSQQCTPARRRASTTMRRSSSEILSLSLSSRRASMESGMGYSFRSDEEFVGSAPGADDPAANFAPRRQKSFDSRPDCCADEADAQSLSSGVSGLSLLSDVSGLLEEDTEACTKADRDASKGSEMKAMKTSGTAGTASITRSHMSLNDACSATKSEASGYSKSSFVCEGLIVDFSSRNTCKDQDDEGDEDGLIVGFVDRSDRFDEIPDRSTICYC